MWDVANEEKHMGLSLIGQSDDAQTNPSFVIQVKMGRKSITARTLLIFD